MGLLEREFLRKYVLFTFVLLGLLVGSAAGNVVLIGRNVSLSFPDVEANFARPIKRSGECGVLYVAEPLDACGPLTNQVGEGSGNPFALIIRGGCTFDAKVRSAQNAGFKAAIVYDNEDNGIVISKFHAFCVDCWLTSWRTFCPVCKQDVRASIANLPASEGTPLLSSGAATPASNAGLSSYHSSMAASPAIHISTMPPGHNQIPGHIHSLVLLIPQLFNLLQCLPNHNQVHSLLSIASLTCIGLMVTHHLFL
ncbi:E3 ubiquitin-protein ligase [Musa troglodytarum]|uniref:E3 ubiquitin-protein ligase n=1 Tax=Musa troglodytarum TaxID=320322 RepID=A0A9E7GY31_9LILI|nr:E3 ubiquitin-protein ligase [Musa troglodytarum]